MRNILGILWLIGIILPCNGVTRIPPEMCEMKQVLYGMQFPVPFCRACKDNTCFMTKLTEDAERQIKAVFTGFFFTSEHIARVEKANIQARTPTRRKRGNANHDGDLHCPTQLRCQNITRMTNIYGIVRELVHLPVIGEYQWVLTGECADVDQDCPGSCVEETTTQFLLVWNLDHPLCPMSFEPFDIKAYCSCKNISTG